MTKKEKILKLLDGVVHPETGKGLADGGFVHAVEYAEEADETCGVKKIVIAVLKFARTRDPFAASLSRQASAVLTKAFPEAEISVTIYSPEAAPKPETSKRLKGIEHIIAVSGGKGGVGKSTVAAALARALAAGGARVGVLDADIYGPSQPALFGVENYLPVAEPSGDDATMVPAESEGVKIMSIGFFITPSDALVWRGPMATSALRQLIRQTAWGSLDFLVVDLPPGTGDVHLSLVHELQLDGAIVVSTPSDLAVADVRRGVEMFRADGVGVPVLGLIENMAWFSPAEMPDNKYFIFGKGKARQLADEQGIEFLGEIPLVISAGNVAAPGVVAPEVVPYYERIARRIVDKLSTGRR